jgi:hypothetical protein
MELSTAPCVACWNKHMVQRQLTVVSEVVIAIWGNNRIVCVLWTNSAERVMRKLRRNIPPPAGIVAGPAGAIASCSETI